MFEVGKRYDFHMNIDGHKEGWSGVIEKIDWPLIKLEDATPENNRFLKGDEIIRGEIINVTSTSFVSAKLAE